MGGADFRFQSDVSLESQFLAVRGATEALAAPLSVEDQQVQSMPDASPTKWHLAHTTWFFETFLLRPHVPGYRLVSADFEVLFNSYYNSVGKQFDRSRRGMLSRPSLADILDYRQRVTSAMLPLLSSPSEAVRRLVLLGLHHEQQHQELLLTDIRHVLWQNPTYPAYQPLVGPVPDQVSADPSPDFSTYEGGEIFVGAKEEKDHFHFDNEGPRHRALLGPFELANRPLTNGDVLNFIGAGGYDNPLLWLSDGWSFKCQRELKYPLYYVPRKDGGFDHFTLQGLVALDPRETASSLSFFEADAMARFLGARLPTEQEWEHAARSQVHAEHVFDASAVRPPIAKSCPEGPLQQMLGGVWEWTMSPYVAYPGFVPQAGAVGEYNGKFMHNQMVLRGGSCATPSDHVRITYRNFFPSSAQWQFSGARLARGNESP